MFSGGKESKFTILSFLKEKKYGRQSHSHTVLKILWTEKNDTLFYTSEIIYGFHLT